MSFGYDYPGSARPSHQSWISGAMRLSESPTFHGSFKTLAVMVLAIVLGHADVSAQTTDDEAPSSELGPESSPAGLGVSTNETTVEGSDQGVALRSLEERVNALKERVFRSKARLVLLRETVLNGVISGARAVIGFRNEMGASFTLERVSFALDGEPLLNKADADGKLDGQSQISLFEGSIIPGTHNLSVLLVYRGNGYGVFTYLKAYTFKIRASYPFTAQEGKLVTVNAVAYERGGITTDLQDRPAIRFETEVKQDVRAPAPGTERTP